MAMNPLRLRCVAKRYKPRVTAWSRRTVREVVTLHKRKVRHAAKQYLKTGHRHDLDRMSMKITDWHFD